MDKIMRSSYCIYRYIKLSPCKTSPVRRHVSSSSDPHSSSYTTHELGLSKYNGRRIPFHFCKCCFHTNSVYCKRNEKLLNKIVNRHRGNDESNLENSNWNLHSDPGLNELVTDMKRGFTHLEDSSPSAVDKHSINDDPELKQILTELREDFQKEEDKQDNKEEESVIDDRLTDKEILPIISTEEIEDFTYEEEDDVQPEWIPPVELKKTLPKTRIIGYTLILKIRDSEIPPFSRVDRVKRHEWKKSLIFNKGGTKGVFDIEELVTVLESENAKDLCVIQLPEQLRLADYMVIVSGISIRHCRAMTSTVQWIYKRKKKGKDPFLKVEGIDSKDGWMAFDLGNIILHVFMPDTRELYDLETLWTVGEQYDDRSLEVDNQLGIKQSDLEWLQDLDVENMFEKKHS